MKFFDIYTAEKLNKISDNKLIEIIEKSYHDDGIEVTLSLIKLSNICVDIWFFGINK
jgi:hypothetical protein